MTTSTMASSKAFRRQAGGDFGELGLDPGDDALRIGTAQAEHQPFDCFSTTALGHNAVAGQGTETHLGDIADLGHHAVFGL